MKQLLVSASYRIATILLIPLCVIVSGCSDSASISGQTVEVPLASLTITPLGSIQPAFSSNTTSYSATVATAVTSVTVTASPKSSTTTIIINGTITPAGQGYPVSLGQPGSRTPIEVVASSQNGLESRYTITVIRRLSGDNRLSDLKVTTSTVLQPLSPGFDGNVLNYTVNVATTVEQITITATKSDLSATMLMRSVANSVSIGPGINPGQLPVTLGNPGTTTSVSITVTAPSGAAETYSVTINRLFSNDSLLSALQVNAGSLDPPFAPDTENYTVKIGLLVPDVTITATKSDPNATMSALGSVIATAGTPTGQVTITPGLGPNPPVGIAVIAQDGVSSTTYNVTVIRGL
ncbi:MAG: cadherin-like beta sandwich domain-containing protein [Nitrospira sp.]|nr:cadherin-like beta sandwich domain-containing protein [Nitrospira sp.]